MTKDVYSLRKKLKTVLETTFNVFTDHTGHVVTGITIKGKGPGPESEDLPTHTVEVVTSPYASVIENEGENTWEVKSGKQEYDFHPELCFSFYYTKADGSGSFRRVNGMFLDESKDGNLLVKAYDLDRGEPRTFRADRISKWVLTPTH